jgi:DNA-binding transcriptional regulator YiaG
MAKLKTRITKEVETKAFSKLEARRRFLGATQSDIAGIIGVSTRTYLNWVKIGTTQKNVDRIGEALLTYSKKAY